MTEQSPAQRAEDPEGLPVDAVLVDQDDNLVRDDYETFFPRTDGTDGQRVDARTDGAQGPASGATYDDYYPPSVGN